MTKDTRTSFIEDREKVGSGSLEADYVKAISQVTESNLQFFNSAAEQILERFVPWPWDVQQYETYLKQLSSIHINDAKASIRLKMGNVEEKLQRDTVSTFGVTILTRIREYLEKARQKQRATL